MVRANDRHITIGAATATVRNAHGDKAHPAGANTLPSNASGQVTCARQRTRRPAAGEVTHLPGAPRDKMAAQPSIREETEMRLACALVLASAMLVRADEPDLVSVEVSGTVDGRGLPMAECDSGVHRIKLTVKLDKKGQGNGTLVLDSTPNPIDDFGFAVTVKAEPPLKLECTIKLVGTKKVLAEGPAGGPAVEVEWQQYEITGPKIVSKLLLARETRAGWTYARFLWATKEGKDRTLVILHGPEPEVRPLAPPCHPGCFPAGTPIEVPGGVKAIEELRPGHEVTTIEPDGKTGRGKVTAMFERRTGSFRSTLKAR